MPKRLLQHWLRQILKLIGQGSLIDALDPIQALAPGVERARLAEREEVFEEYPRLPHAHAHPIDILIRTEQLQRLAAS